MGREEMFFERTLRGEINHIFTRIFFQFLGTNSPVQNPSRNGVQYFNSNVETESAGRRVRGRGGERRKASEEIGLPSETKGFT